MKTRVIGTIILILGLAGCHQVAIQSLPSFDPAPTLEAQAGKDTAIVDWSAKIDARLADLLAGRATLEQVAADIKAATAGQREEVRKAPSAQFNVVVEGYKSKADADAKEIARLKKERDGLRDAERKKQILILRGLGILCAVGAGALIYFGPRSFAGLAGVVSVILLGLAQLISQPWFDLAFNIALGVTFVSFLGVGLYEWRQKLKGQRTASAHDDVISGVEDVRALFLNPPAELAEIVRNASTTSEAIEAVRKLGHAIDAKMAEYVTKEDGTHAIIQERRRALKLIS